MRREMYPKVKFNPVSVKVPDFGSVGILRLKKILQVKDEAIHDKKAEICRLREQVGDLKLLVNMMIRESNN